MKTKYMYEKIRKLLQIQQNKNTSLLWWVPRPTGK